MIEFDGQNRIIYISNAEVEIEEIYSRWKDWVLKDLNAMFFQAFVQEGDDNIRYYLINDWKIEPKDSNQSLIINGNLIIDGK